MNAWPATHQMLVDGWLIRLSNGFTKRANCVVPLYLAHGSAANHSTVSEEQQLEKVRYCENLYAREQLQTIFRLTSVSPNTTLDSLLERRGYVRVDKTRVQVANLQQVQPRNEEATPATSKASNSDHPVFAEFQIVTAPEWLRAYSALAEMPASASELHANLIRSIRPDCAFAVLTAEDQPIACALGVLEHDLIGLFDVITARAHRGQGRAQQLLTELLHWGAAEGAEHAYLQVIADNTAALALYQRLGFVDLYSYWYRQTG